MATAAETPLIVLRESNFGRRTAEEEQDHLHQYFVETEQWRRVFGGEIDVVYGPKGSGKSAIYNLILKNQTELFDRGIIVIPGENPQGTPAFQHLSKDAPRDEFEFVSLWKLFVLTLCGQAMKEYGISGDKSSVVIHALEEADLLPGAFSLSKALTYVFDYIKSLNRIEALEGGITLDPHSGMPNGVKGKIYLREPSVSQAKLGGISVDELLATANDALKVQNLTLWILLDRLDVAFADKPTLEVEALRALFKFYLDTKQYSNIRSKIFLRTDIWEKITAQGFREASHIERSLTIVWRDEDLMNLVARRALANTSICQFYEADRDRTLADFKAQEEFLYEMIPDQVESGPNKPNTFTWLLSRTSDGSRAAAPRELIHFLNELRDVQISRLERGEKGPQPNRLFEQIAFKEALPAVSKVRLEQTIFAEFPSLKPYIEKLREQKATQNAGSLAVLWNLPEAEVSKLASELETVGFFEKLGAANWRVPFLYRPALGLVQGSADS